jgi:acetoin utilization deacetylase AcuC-like enzyme
MEEVRVIVNTPLPADAGGPAFRNAVTNIWIPAIEKFKSKMVLVSAGYEKTAMARSVEVHLRVLMGL